MCAAGGELQVWLGATGVMWCGLCRENCSHRTWLCSVGGLAVLLGDSNHEELSRPLGYIVHYLDGISQQRKDGFQLVG